MKCAAKWGRSLQVIQDEVSHHQGGSTVKSSHVKHAGVIGVGQRKARARQRAHDQPVITRISDHQHAQAGTYQDGSQIQAGARCHKSIGVWEWTQMQKSPSWFHWKIVYFQKFEKIIWDTLQQAYIDIIILLNFFYFQENRMAISLIYSQVLWHCFMLAM